MKKVFAVIIVLSLAFLISCGDETKKITKTDSDAVDVTDENANDSGDSGITDTDISNTGELNDADTSDTGEVIDTDTNDTGELNDADTSDTGEVTDTDTGDTSDTADDDISDTGTDETPDVDNAPNPCSPCDLSNRNCVEQDENWVCGGCKEGYYEDTDNICVMKGALGNDCDAATYAGEDCTDGKCVDGVCCDSDCDGLCESCNVSEFHKGYCTPQLAGTDPDNECQAGQQADCDLNGFCDGLGQCQIYDTTTICQPPYCNGNYSVSTAYCNGTDSCDTASTVSTNCTPYTCEVASGLCKAGSCTGDGDCVAGYYCEGTTCTQKKSNGSLCTANDQCFSGDCTLDDFGSDGLSYCVPKAPAYCAKESSYYAANSTFCVTTGGTTYKKCTPDSWGDDINCTNITTRGCKPSGYVNNAGYYSKDSCEDTTSGAVCNEDTTCDPCSYTIKGVNLPNGTTGSATSVYAFASTSCYRTCLDKLGTAYDSYCGQTSSTGSHFCYSTTTILNTKIGICVEKLANGAACEKNSWCQSGFCVSKKCTKPL